MHQYARLTTARARQHQKVAAWRGHRFALFVIKAVEQVRNVDWHRRVKIGRAEKRNALRQKAGYIYRSADYIGEVRDANREISRCGSKRLSQVCIRSPFPGSVIQQACIPLRIAPPTSVVRSSPTRTISPIRHVEFFRSQKVHIAERFWSARAGQRAAQTQNNPPNQTVPAGRYRLAIAAERPFLRQLF